MQPSKTELILIRITGEDRPGLTASVTEILAKYDATILDIGQADIHNTLSLGILCMTEEHICRRPRSPASSAWRRTR